MRANVRFIPFTGFTLAALALTAAPFSALAQLPASSSLRPSAKTVVRKSASVPMQTLQRSVPNAVARAQKLNRLAANTRLTVYLCFHFADPQAAKDYTDAVNDVHSLLYGQWLTPEEIGQRFGPAPADYQAGLKYLKDNGLAVTNLPAHQLAIQVTGTAAQMEKAFGVELSVYREAPVDAVKRAAETTNVAPVTFFAPAKPVQIPASLAGKVSAVVGLQNYSRPAPHLRKKRDTIVGGPFTVAQTRSAYHLSTLCDSGLYGQGRTIGISNFDGVNVALNGPVFISANGLPVPVGGATSNITRVTVGAGNGTNGQVEGDVDFQMVLGMAPLANIIIYDTGPDTNGDYDYYGVLSQELSDNEADIITESYGWGLSGSDADAFNSLHQAMSMAGITYVAASGDTGNIANSPYPYPDYEPEVMNIGGTTLQYDVTTAQYVSESGWGGSGGGFTNDPAGVNSRPAYQQGRGIPTSPSQRLTPDVSSVAAGSSSGVYYFYYGGGQNSGYDGTSFASPIVAGSLAIVEEYLALQSALPANSAGKQRLGRLNDRIYGFNGRNDIFHDITTGSSGGANGNPNLNATPYWDYVTGWGSLDFYNLAIALKSPLTVTVSPASATLAPGQSLRLSASVSGSVNTDYTWSVASGPGTISSDGVYTAPANVTPPQTVVIKATSALDTAAVGDARTTFQTDPVSGSATLTIPVYRTVSGAIMLDGISDPAQTAVPLNPFTFVLTTAGAAPITITQTLGTGGSFRLTNIPAATYSMTVKGDKWLRAKRNIVANYGDVTGLAFTLPGGDANNDNSIDASDFGILITTYNSSVNAPGSGYDSTADFNNDGFVDVSDFSILVDNYGAVGAN